MQIIGSTFDPRGDLVVLDAHETAALHDLLRALAFRGQRPNPAERVAHEVWPTVFEFIQECARAIEGGSSAEDSVERARNIIARTAGVEMRKVDFR